MLLAQRQATMHYYNVSSFTTLADAFARFNPNTIPVQLLVLPTLPIYSPSDDDEEEEDRND